MTLKQQLYNICQEFIDIRLKTIKRTIADIELAFQSETKSSAGDKHETGLAMLQLEREKVGQQLAEAQKTQSVLQKINISKKYSQVALGSIVETTGINYFIAISAGEIKLDEKVYYAISPSTPIAKLLLSKKVNEQIQFRSSTFVITRVE